MITRLMLGVGAIGVLVVVIQSQMEASRAAAWAELAAARAAGFDVESLEDAREAVEGTEVEPWVAYYLATEIYSTGEDLDRARQVASEAVEAYGDHATAPMLQELLDAIVSYDAG